MTAPYVNIQAVPHFPPLSHDPAAYIRKGIHFPCFMLSEIDTVRSHISLHISSIQSAEV